MHRVLLNCSVPIKKKCFVSKNRHQNVIRNHIKTANDLRLNAFFLQNWDGSEISLYLQANKLDCHSIMEAGRRNKFPDQRQSTYYFRHMQHELRVCTLSSLRRMKNGCGGCCTHGRFMS